MSGSDDEQTLTFAHHVCLSVCLSHSTEREMPYFQCMNLVMAIYEAAAKLQSQLPKLDAPGVGRVSSDDEEIESQKPDRVKKRRTSGSSSSQTAALEAFKMAMAAASPAQPKSNLPTTVPEFFAAVMLTDEQKKSVMSQLPASSAPPSFAVLCVFTDDILVACGLSLLQVAAWKKLADKLF